METFLFITEEAEAEAGAEEAGVGEEEAETAVVVEGAAAVGEEGEKEPSEEDMLITEAIPGVDLTAALKGAHTPDRIYSINRSALFPTISLFTRLSAAPTDTPLNSSGFSCRVNLGPITINQTLIREPSPLLPCSGIRRRPRRPIVAEEEEEEEEEVEVAAVIGTTTFAFRKR